MSNIPAHLLTPRDWQAEAVAHAARECGTPEGRRALAEATRYGALADRLADLQAALDAEHAQRIALQHHAADQAQRVADLEALVAELLACLRDCVEDTDEAICRHLEAYGETWRSGRLQGLRDQAARARAAIARAKGGAA